jgi:predicted RNA-binding protein YlxR (DUF448 family)
MRVVRTPAGEIILDASGRAPGRGAYVCRTNACLDKAIAKGALSRALTTRLPADLRDALAEGITEEKNTIIEGGARGQE